MKKNTESIIPLGVGYSRRLIFAFIFIAAIIVLVFVSFVFRYSSQTIKHQETRMIVDDDPRSSVLLHTFLKKENDTEKFKEPYHLPEPLDRTAEIQAPIEEHHSVQNVKWEEARQSEISIFKKNQCDSRIEEFFRCSPFGSPHQGIVKPGRHL